MPRIDVHHHFFSLLFIDKTKLNESIGWRMPSENLPWTPEISLRFMDESHIDIAILSFVTISSGEVGQENRDKIRKLNLMTKEICEKYPDRFGFFASLPIMDDVEGHPYQSVVLRDLTEQRVYRCLGGNCICTRHPWCSRNYDALFVWCW